MRLDPLDPRKRSAQKKIGLENSMVGIPPMNFPESWPSVVRVVSSVAAMESWPSHPATGQTGPDSSAASCVQFQSSILELSEIIGILEIDHVRYFYMGFMILLDDVLIPLMMF